MNIITRMYLCNKITKKVGTLVRIVKLCKYHVKLEINFKGGTCNNNASNTIKCCYVILLNPSILNSAFNQNRIKFKMSKNTIWPQAFIEKNVKLNIAV